MASVWQLLEEISQSLAQPLTTEQEKDSLILKLRTQLALLRAQISQNPAKSASQTRNVATQTQHCTLDTYNGMYVQRPLEDTTDSWWVCSCGEEECPTCQAERAATVCTPPLQTYFNYSRTQEVSRGTQPSKITQKARSVPPDEAEHSDVKQKPVTRNREHESEDTVLHQDDPELRKVRVTFDPMKDVTGKCSWYLFQLHPSISASGVPGNAGNPLAAGIMALVFSHKATESPLQLMVFTTDSTSHLTENIYEMIRSAIVEGSEMYRVNYRDQEVALSAADTVLITSHLGFQLKTEATFDTLVVEMLIHYLANLECGETLLFIKQEHYKAISVICRSFKGRKELIIFDPQRHDVVLPKTRMRDIYGVYLSYTYCEMSYIVQAVTQIYHYCGRLTGPCSVAVLNK